MPELAKDLIAYELTKTHLKLGKHNLKILYCLKLIVRVIELRPKKILYFQFPKNT